MTRRKKPNPTLVSSAARPGDPRENLEDAIRKRAFKLYEERGKADGYATEDWLRAETEVIAQRRNRTPENVKGS